MIKILRVLLLLSLTNMACSCQVSNSSLSHYQCTVSMQNCNGQLRFQNCLQRYCANFERRYQSGKIRTYCANYSFYRYNQKECLSKCCGQAGAGKDIMDKKMLDVCVQQSYKQSNLAGIIGGSVFAGVALIAIIVGVIYWKRKQNAIQANQQTVNTLGGK